MKVISILLLVVAFGCFVAATVLGATPAAARCTNAGLALGAGALLIEALPV